MISLVVYHFYGERSVPEGDAEDKLEEDAITCGINTNMCAALLHVVSDLARSTTTFIESIVILCVPTIPSTTADGYSTLVVCGIIVIGATAAVLTWMREVYLFMISKP